MKTILYVSQSVIPEAAAEAEVDRILEVARARNVVEHITGALIFTGARFAQLLEGPAEGVDRVIASIESDARHMHVTLLPTRGNAVRRFADWSMAYSGRSAYVDRHLKPLLAPLSSDEQLRGSELLIELMLAFTGEGAGTR